MDLGRQAQDSESLYFDDLLQYFAISRPCSYATFVINWRLFDIVQLHPNDFSRFAIDAAVRPSLMLLMIKPVCSSNGLRLMLLHRISGSPSIYFLTVFQSFLVMRVISLIEFPFLRIAWIVRINSLRLVSDSESPLAKLHFFAEDALFFAVI